MCNLFYTRIIIFFHLILNFLWYIKCFFLRAVHLLCVFRQILHVNSIQAWFLRSTMVNLNGGGATAPICHQESMVDLVDAHNFLENTI